MASILDIRSAMAYNPFMDRQTRYTGHQLGKVLSAQGRKKRWLASQVGVHESLIGKIITGHRTASEELARGVANALGLPLFLLFDVHDGTDSVPCADGTEEAA